MFFISLVASLNYFLNKDGFSGGGFMEGVIRRL